MPVPFLDLKAHHAPLRTELERAVVEVLDSQSFILGPTVARFEQHMAEHLGVPHAVGVSSGSDALLVSLLAEGVGPGDEVVTTPFTFFATAGSIARAGARPVFADIDPQSLNLDPASAERALSERTRALMPVHLFGRGADMGALTELAGLRQLAVIEDAAQALGTRCTRTDGSALAGTLGTYGCFSFFPSKNLGGAGDGGLVVCHDEERATRLRRLRAHGASAPHLHELVGGNFRLDALQAALLAVKLPHLEGWIARRRANAERYRRLFQEAGLSGADVPLPGDGVPVALPAEVPGHSYNQFVVRVRDREPLTAWLRQRGIGHAVYYPRPLHLQPALSELGYGPGAFPAAERAALEVLALPIFPELSEGQAVEVVETMAAFYAGRGR